MSTPSLVPMVGPDGSSADVPVEQVGAAMRAGAKRAAAMLAPDGSRGYVPLENVSAARQAGAKLASEVPTQFENERNPANQPGAFKSFIQEVPQIAAGIASMGAPKGPSDVLGMVGQMAADDLARKLAGRSGAYRAVAGVGSLAGVNAPKMEQQAEVGNARGIIGTAAADALPAALPAAVRGARAVAGNVPSVAEVRPQGPAANVMPEAAALPPQARFGAEKIFRASAPTGGNPQFRENLYTAAGDLAEIGRQVNLAEAKGGIINPDMRVRATVEAINDHLQQMYQQERAPVIARNADNAVVPKLTPDSAEALTYLTRRGASTDVRALAANALQHESIPLAQADALARAVNRELVDLNSMTPSDRASALGTNRRLGALQALDGSLGDAINGELSNRGEPGLQLYEKRYATLSQVRDQLQRRMNAVELNQPGLIKTYGRQLASFITQGPKGIASASQAAVADVNIGAELQHGLQNLADSGIIAQRAVGAGAPPVRGLLPAPQIQLPGSMEPITPTSEPQAGHFGNGATPEPASAVDNSAADGSMSRERIPYASNERSKSAAVPPPVRPGTAPAAGADTIVRVPGEDRTYSARYQVRELSDVQASHSGATFQQNPRYALTNDRDYSNVANQGKIIFNSGARFDPAYHLTDNPDATNGPIVIDSQGHALGGNGRTMILERVYRGNPQGAQAYRQMLTQKAAQFGIDPQQVANTKRPVLVREINDAEFDQPASKQGAITDFNKKGTAELTPSERAISDSRRISDATLNMVAGHLERAPNQATLADVLNASTGPELIDRLISDGVITQQERAAYVGPTGLTTAGKERIGKLIVGRYFRDAGQLDGTPPSVRGKIERMAAPMAKVSGLGEWDLDGVMREANDVLEEMRAHDLRNVDDLKMQQGFFADSRYSPEALAMAKKLQRSSALGMAEATRKYSVDAMDAQRGLLGGAISQPQAFREAFDRP